jgi:hypothetical protein
MAEASESMSRIVTAHSRAYAKCEAQFLECVSAWNIDPINWGIGVEN